MTLQRREKVFGMAERIPVPAAPGEARDLGAIGGGPVPGGGMVSGGKDAGTGSGALTEREEEGRRRAEGTPAQPQAAMGSQDSESHTTSQDEIQAVDPMTSRDPRKIAAKDDHA